jgi:hypothetical protein
MKNNLKALIILLLSMTWQMSYAQDLFLKASGIVLSGSSSERKLLDVGIEAAIYKNWHCQVSYSIFDYRGEGASKNKKIWSLQARQYLSKVNEKDSYYGIVFQKYQLQDRNSVYSVPRDTFLTKFATSIENNQFGLGGILGSNIKIYKRFGIDFHIGGVAQIGKKDTRLTFAKNGNLLPSTSEIQKGKITIRPFWGLNFYIALGKFHPTRDK